MKYVNNNRINYSKLFVFNFQTLLETYSDHDNKDELWKDMFCRLVAGSDAMYAGSIFRWIRDDQNIRSAIAASIADLRRERDKVIVSMKQVIRRRDEEKQRLWNHKVRFGKKDFKDLVLIKFEV